MKECLQMDHPATPKPEPIVWTFFEGYKHAQLLQGPYAHATIWPIETNNGAVVYFASVYNRAATEIHLREILVDILPALYESAVQDTLERLIKLIFSQWADGNSIWKPEYLGDVRPSWSIVAELLPLADVKRAAAVFFQPVADDLK